MAWALLLLVAALRIGAFEPGDGVVLRFKDGGKAAGTWVSETSEKVTIAVPGGRAAFPKDQLASMEPRKKKKKAERFERTSESPPILGPAWTPDVAPARRPASSPTLSEGAPAPMSGTGSPDCTLPDGAPDLAKTLGYQPKCAPPSYPGINVSPALLLPSDGKTRTLDELLKLPREDVAPGIQRIVPSTSTTPSRQDRRKR